MAASSGPHPLVRLAQAAIQAFVCEGRVLCPDEVPGQMPMGRAGVFVTLRQQHTGDLRGCIGTIEPAEPSLAEETIHNAIASASRDWRFPPVRPEEVPDLEIEVSVLYPPEPISSVAELDPSQYGVIVQRGWQRGLLLPDIEGIDDARLQVSIARQKAGIGPHEPVRLSRFRVDKYT